jgi:hypothetical protein
MDAQLVEYFAPCMQPEGALPCSQQPATGPYHEPHDTNPHLYILVFPNSPFYYYHPTLSFRLIHVICTDSETTFCEFEALCYKPEGRGFESQ